MVKTLMRAIIREVDCIGCGKCIPPCPVDAIIGSQKQMHTVITDECIGCKLCVAPCPVDCIDMVKIPEQVYALKESKLQKSHYIHRYQARKKRLQQNVMIQEKPIPLDKKAYLQAALLRAKSKSKIKT